MGLVTPEEFGIFLDQGLNSRFLHWQADSLPLSHQDSPIYRFLSSFSFWLHWVLVVLPPRRYRCWTGSGRDFLWDQVPRARWARLLLFPLLPLFLLLSSFHSGLSGVGSLLQYEGYLIEACELSGAARGI